MFNLKETFTITTKDTLKQESLQNSIIRMSNPGKVKIIIITLLASSKKRGIRCYTLNKATLLDSTLCQKVSFCNYK